MFDLNFGIFSDNYNVKLCNLNSSKIETIYSSNSFVLCVKLSPDNSFVAIGTIDYLVTVNLITSETKTIDYYKRFATNLQDIYIYRDFSIKLGFKNGSILLYKNDSISVLRKNTKGVFTYGEFSNDGKILILSKSGKDGKIILIHENATVDDDEICLKNEISFDCLCLSKDLKVLVACQEHIVKTYDISRIGNVKRDECSAFLTMLKGDKCQSISIFKNDYFYDDNTLKLIFDFLPVSTENFKMKKIN